MNALYTILLKFGLVCVRMCLYDIKMTVGMCLNALYMILLKERWYESECALYVIIKMSFFMCLNAKFMFS